MRVLVEHRHRLVQMRTRAKNGLQAMALSYDLWWNLATDIRGTVQPGPTNTFRLTEPWTLLMRFLHRGTLERVFTTVTSRGYFMS